MHRQTFDAGTNGLDNFSSRLCIPMHCLFYHQFLQSIPRQLPVSPNKPMFLVQKLRSMVHEIVGRINGHYGTLTHVPIHHLDRQLSFHELCALYAITDVALVTSLRDGMNLVSYEYVACQSDNAGKNLPAVGLRTVCN